MLDESGRTYALADCTAEVRANGWYLGHRQLRLAVGDERPYGKHGEHHAHDSPPIAA